MIDSLQFQSIEDSLNFKNIFLIHLVSLLLFLDYMDFVYFTTT